MRIDSHSKKKKGPKPPPHSVCVFFSCLCFYTHTHKHRGCTHSRTPWSLFSCCFRCSIRCATTLPATTKQTSLALGECSLRGCGTTTAGNTSPCLQMSSVSTCARTWDCQEQRQGILAKNQRTGRVFSCWKRCVDVSPPSLRACFTFVKRSGIGAKRSCRTKCWSTIARGSDAVSFFLKIQ